MSEPVISIIIVTYNSRHLIDDCLRPIPLDNKRIQVLVWDNASKDGTGDYIQSTYPEVKVIQSETNFGFAGGNNRCFEMCRGQFVMLLNPDAFLPAIDVVWQMISVLVRDESIAAIGPQLVHADGRHQVGDCGWRFSNWSLLAHFLFWHRLFAFIPAYWLSNPSFLKRPFVEVDWVCAACMVVRLSIIRKIGGLDSRIFMYGEDAEWGERMRDAGLRVLYMPGILVTHLQGGTQKTGDEPFMSSKFIESLGRRMRERSSGMTFFLLKCAISMGLYIRCITMFFQAIFDLNNGRQLARSRIFAKYAWAALSL